MGVGYCRQDGGGGALDGIPDRAWDGVPATWLGSRQRWGSTHVVGYQTGMVGYQTRMVGYQTGMVGYQTGDDEVPGRGRVTTLMSHQSEILHSLIF